jgi:hypothetical protein
MMKAVVESQKNDIVQFYSFVLGDVRYEYEAVTELDVMGFYKKIGRRRSTLECRRIPSAIHKYRHRL